MKIFIIFTLLISTYKLGAQCNNNLIRNSSFEQKDFLVSLVGIGTINPGAEMHIKAIPNSNCDLVLENAYGHKWDLASNGNNHFSLYQPSTGLNRIEVTETGNVEIETSEPQAKLDVRGTGSFLKWYNRHCS